MLKGKRFKDYHFEILDSIADLVRVKDLDDNIIYTNKEAEKDDKVNVFSKHRNLDLLKSRITNTEEIINGRNYLMKASPIFNVEGEKIASVEVFRDITREKELEAALSESVKEIESDLLFAKMIQRRILPNKGDYGDIYIDYRYQPSADLSGDLFDIFDIDKNHVGIYIVDVAGHGIAASMMTVFIRQTMYTVATSTKSPSETLRALQRHYRELGLSAERYFTMFYGVYNKEKREFKYANAGHNSIPFVFNDQSITMLVNYGLPITGLDLGNTYNDKTVKLNPGDSILLYTDGLIEATNEDGEEFGEDRVKLAILNNEGNLLAEIEEKHSNFINDEQQDDIAMLLMKVN